MLKAVSQNTAKLYMLQITSPDSDLRKIPLEDDEIIVGKSENSHIKLNMDEVPEKSFQFLKTSDGYMIEIMDAKEILINNQKFDRKTKLKSGDLITCFNHQLQYLETDPSEENKPAADPDAGKTQFMQVFTIQEIKSKGRLLGISGSVKGKVFDFTKDKVSVGRDSSNDICIEDDGLSRAHAMMEIGDKTITIIDFNSTNGTFIKGKRINTETVKPGTIIQFANAALRYETNETPLATEAELTPQKGHFYRNLLVFLIIAGFSGYGIFVFMQKQQKDLEKEKNKLEALLKAKDETKEPENEDLSIAEKAFRDGNLEEAGKIVETLLEKNPSQAQAILLKGKIDKALLLDTAEKNCIKGMNYYQANEFSQAKQALSGLTAEFPKYAEVKSILSIIDKLPEFEALLERAKTEFDDGKIDNAIETVSSVLKSIPVFKKAKQYSDFLQEVLDLLHSAEEAEKTNDKAELDKQLNALITLISSDRNYYYNQAYKKLNTKSSNGKALKNELFYSRAIEAMAKRNYGDAYLLLKEAMAQGSNQLKTKIALSEVKKKRTKILQTLHAAIPYVSTPQNAKKLWKKIVNLGTEENPYYEEAINRLQNQE